MPRKTKDDEQAESIKELKQAFDLIANDDGFIEKNDLKNVMKSVGQNPTNYELDIMIEEADADGDKKIDFPEFVAVFMRFLGKRKRAPDPNEFENLFDGDNLSAAKIVAEMEKLGVQLDLNDIKTLIKEADIDSDGLINKKEFDKMIESDFVKQRELNKNTSSK